MNTAQIYSTETEKQYISSIQISWGRWIRDMFKKDP